MVRTIIKKQVNSDMMVVMVKQSKIFKTPEHSNVNYADNIQYITNNW